MAIEWYYARVDVEDFLARMHTIDVECRPVP